MSKTAMTTFAARSRDVMPGGVTSANRAGPGLEDLVVDRAAGGYFWDSAGREYLDLHCAGGPTVLGHCHTRVDRLARERSARLDLVGVARNELEVQLAESVVRHVPGAERVLFTTSGSEGTYHALRLARAATGRRRVLKFEGCYHGWHDSVALGFSPSMSTHEPRRPMSAGSIPEVLEATTVVDFNDLDAVGTELAAGDVAAVIVEPVAHNVGALLPDPAFLPGLREACTRTGAVLVFDEVITGFRHALGGYQAIAGVTPDLTILGKAMGNGYPIAALAGRADLMSAFSTDPSGDVLFAGTYNGHPMCVAAAIETIRVMEEEPVHDHLFALGSSAREGLQEVARLHDLETTVAGLGSIHVAYFMAGPARRFADLLANDSAAFTSYRRSLIEDGVFEFPVNLKRAHWSYAHTLGDVARMLEAADAAMHDIVRGKGSQP